VVILNFTAFFAGKGGKAADLKNGMRKERASAVFDKRAACPREAAGFDLKKTDAHTRHESVESWQPVTGN
jgi:hypothetical protein